MEIISQHPLATVLIVWGLFMLVVIVLGIKRYHDRKELPYSNGLEDQLHLDFTVEDRMTPELEQMADRLHRIPASGVAGIEGSFSAPRIPMRNRFLEPTEGDVAMAEQILHDQAVAHEEPGAVVEDSAVEPDATTFYHLREVVGQFTYVLGKDGYVGVIEAMRSGDDAPIVEVPEEWREPITVAVFEVVRLRAASGRAIPSSELIALLDDPAIAGAVNERGSGRHA